MAMQTRAFKVRPSSVFIVSEHTGKEVVTQGVQDLFNVSFTEY